MPFQREKLTREGDVILQPPNKQTKTKRKNKLLMLVFNIKNLGMFRLFTLGFLSPHHKPGSHLPQDVIN